MRTSHPRCRTLTTLEHPDGVRQSTAESAEDHNSRDDASAVTSVSRPLACAAQMTRGFVSRHSINEKVDS